MTAFDPEQALARWMKLWEKRHQEFDQLPDVNRRVARGNYEFFSSADSEMHELEREAQRNGYVLEWTFDRDTMEFEYTCEKMTPEDYEAYLEWEKEE